MLIRSRVLLIDWPPAVERIEMRSTKRQPPHNPCRKVFPAKRCTGAKEAIREEWLSGDGLEAAGNVLHQCGSFIVCISRPEGVNLRVTLAH